MLRVVVAQPWADVPEAARGGVRMLVLRAWRARLLPAWLPLSAPEPIVVAPLVWGVSARGLGVVLVPLKLRVEGEEP
jgi:hypothetical protein